MKPDNVRGVPLIGAPAVWDGVNGFHGEGIKIAIIDTGIDYTHADFGGPGTVAAYRRRARHRDGAGRPALFGPDAPRVKGGIDLVGDNYNADPTRAGYQPIPHPDPNPLDCNGHGSHVAGTAAGSGVLAERHDLHRPVQRDDDHAATRWTSVRASRRRPTSTRSASSAARARPTSTSTPSSGRSTTTWTSSTCRSARRSAPHDDPSAVASTTPPRPA